MPDADTLTAWHAAHLDAHARAHRVAAGVWYTPPVVVQAMFDRVEAHGARVLDPCTGTGVFLAEAARRGARQLIGWDVEPAALLIARLRVPTAELHVCDALAAPRSVPVDLIITNPPWARDKGRGGWVRAGWQGARPLIDDFKAPGAGVHLKNLHNLYVYFWRVALWMAFEAQTGPAAVCLVTPSSYLRGPGFAGMRAWLRRHDTLRVIELGGADRGVSAGANLFGVRTAACIGLVQRGGSGVHDHAGWPVVAWQPLATDPAAPLVPYRVPSTLPALAEVLPHIRSGVKIGRTWPLAIAPDTLRQRWAALDAAGFKDSPTGRQWRRPGPALPGQPKRPALVDAKGPVPPLARYAWRSFDTRWLLADGRLIDRAGPDLWAVHRPDQIYLTTQRTSRLGAGPAATLTAHLPDLHHYAGRGGKDVIPRWTTDGENLAPGVRESLQALWNVDLRPGTCFAYVAAVLGQPGYVTRVYRPDAPDLHVPLTADRALFEAGVRWGERLIAAYTLPIMAQVPTQVLAPPTPGRVRHVGQVLHIGDGRIAPVPAAVWGFKIGTRAVLRRWIQDRLGAGRRSSPLDDIRAPWGPETTADLLTTIARITAVQACFAPLDAWLAAVLAGPLLHTPITVPCPAAADPQPSLNLGATDGSKA